MYRYKARERGQAMVEYALIIATIGVLMISVLTFFGNNINSSFTTINHHLSESLSSL